MLAVAALFLTALTFALPAYAADRTGRQTIAAVLAAGAWLFAGIGVLIGVIIWVWR
jgi:hypothetical protein